LAPQGGRPGDGAAPDTPTQPERTTDAGLEPGTARLQGQKRIGIVKVIDTCLRIVHVQPTGVYDDLARGVEFHVGAVHRPRRGALEIDGFGIVAAAVTRTLELILAGLPFRGATQMRATGEDDEEPVRLLDHPDAVAHQELLIDAEVEIRRIANGKDGIRLIKRPREEEAQEHQEIDTEITADGRPDHPPAHAIGRGLLGRLFGAGFDRRFCRSRDGSGGFSG
jgi:hypothetical protein